MGHDKRTTYVCAALHVSGTMGKLLLLYSLLLACSRPGASPAAPAVSEKKQPAPIVNHGVPMSASESNATQPAVPSVLTGDSDCFGCDDQILPSRPTKIFDCGTEPPSCQKPKEYDCDNLPKDAPSDIRQICAPSSYPQAQYPAPGAR